MKVHQQLLWYRCWLMVGGVVFLLASTSFCPGQIIGDADFDNDLVVSGVDGLIWQRGYGTTFASNAHGDANGDQVVNSADLEVFESQLNSGFARGGIMGSDTTVELWLQLFEATKTFKLLARTSDVHGIAGVNIEILNAETLAFDNSVWSGPTADPTFASPGNPPGRTLFSMQDLGGTVAAGVGSGSFIQLGGGTYLSDAEPFRPRFEHCEVNLLTGMGMAARLAPTPVTMITIESPQPLQGDYNNNNTIDAADYIVWRDTLDQTTPPFPGAADGNGDGIITQADYDLWRAHFGQTASTAAALSSIPEPSALPLAALALSALVVRRTCRRCPSVVVN